MNFLDSRKFVDRRVNNWRPRLTSLSEIKAQITQIEEEFGGMSDLITEMKTSGGHLSNFGDDFVMLCRKYNIPQSKVARAVGVTPTSVNKRYQRVIKKNAFFNPINK